MIPPHAPLPLALYQGCANAWECDEMGHLNVRFHVERAMVSLAVIAEKLAMPRAFTAIGGATLQPREMHIRFLKEARAGAPLVMLGGVVEITENDAVFYFELRHLDGGVSSTFRIRAEHAETRTLAPFAWSQTQRAALETHRCSVPAYAEPRSIDLTKPPSKISMNAAEKLGVSCVGRSIVQPDECDAFGRVRADIVVGRSSDAAPWLMAEFRAMAALAAAQEDGIARQPGGAAMEFRLVLRKWPRAGEHLEIRSGATEIMPKATRIVHWILDPVTGQGWASLEAIAITFDLATRKSYAPPQSVLDAFAKTAIPEMAV